MRIVIDTNIVFSAILNTNSKIAQILLQPGSKVNFYATEQLLKEIASTKDMLVAYLKTIDETEWELDTGVIHYRGNPATVARCVDSLIRDYRKHRQEIIDAIL